MNDLHPLDFYSIILLAPMRLGDHQVCVRIFGLLLLTDSRGEGGGAREPEGQATNCTVYLLYTGPLRGDVIHMPVLYCTYSTVKQASVPF